MPTGQHCNQPTPCDIAPPPPRGIAATAAMPIRCRLNVSSFFLLQRRRPVDCFLIFLRDERLPTKNEWQRWLCGMWNLLHHHAPQQHCHCHQQCRLNVSFFLSMWRQKATTSNTKTTKRRNCSSHHSPTGIPPALRGTKNTTTTHWHQGYRLIVYIF